MHLEAEISDQSALDLITDNCPLSKQKIKNVMRNGAVWLESCNNITRLRRAKKILNTGDKLHLYYDEAIQQTTPEEAMLIADETEYSVWNKPCGMYSQGTKWGDHCTIYRWAETHLQPQRPAFIVHRLDRAANGLILLAHSKKMAAKLSQLFKDRKIIKRYQATVTGHIDISLPLIITDEIDSKPARSTILASRRNEHGDTVLNIEIETGRKHQIRKHLAGIGHPVTGDRLYGSDQTDADLQLQSSYMKFTCPVTNKEKEYSLDG